MPPSSPQQRGPVPRLDVVCGIAGCVTAYLTAFVGIDSSISMGLVDLATITGAIVGVLVGWTIRVILRREEQHATAWQRWWPPLLAWTVGGIIATAVVVVGGNAYYYRRLGAYVAPGFGIGLLGTLASWPACIWLTTRAREAQRARNGSMVAARDRRAIFGALVAWTSLASLVLVPQWRFAFPVGWVLPWKALIAASAALFGAVILLALDLVAAHRLKRIVARLDELDELEGTGNEGEAAKLDVGLGGELFVRDTVGDNYRAGRERVPLVLGNPHLADTILRRSVLASSVRLALLVLPFSAHVFEATHLPDMRRRSGYEEKDLVQWPLDSAEEERQRIAELFPALQ